MSIAWARAFEAVLQHNLRGLAPLVVHITGLENKVLPEVPAIRNLLDATLRQQGLADCHTVANTIFPQNLWEKSANRQELYQRYLKILPRIKRRSRANWYGLYFERMIHFGSGPKDGNQLEHLIDLWQANIRRPSAHQVNIFDPARDHTRQTRRGFPCLQHICFTPLAKEKLAILAVYPSQYLFSKAYGNYLGLYQLGRFLAGEVGLELTQLTCAIGIALPKDGKTTVLRELANAIQPYFQQYANHQQAAIAMPGGIYA